MMVSHRNTVYLCNSLPLSSTLSFILWFSLSLAYIFFLPPHSSFIYRPLLTSLPHLLSSLSLSPFLFLPAYIYHDVHSILTLSDSSSFPYSIRGQPAVLA